MNDEASVRQNEYVIVSSSLRPGSHSRIMAHGMLRAYEAAGVFPQLIDLRDFPLPLCDGGDAYAHPHVEKVQASLAAARVIIVATPVYNFDANAAVKNLIELTGGAWEEKIVGFLCAAGGTSSYMSILGLANSLMLDFRCLILPRFVYAVKHDFADGKIVSDSINERIERLARLSLHVRYA